MCFFGIVKKGNLEGTHYLYKHSKLQCSGVKWGLSNQNGYTREKAHIFLTSHIMLFVIRNTNQGHIKPWLSGGKGCCPSEVYPFGEEEVKGKITLLRLMQCNCFPHDGALPFFSLWKFPWLQKDMVHTFFFFCKRMTSHKDAKWSPAVHLILSFCFWSFSIGPLNPAPHV